MSTPRSTVQEQVQLLGVCLFTGSRQNFQSNSYSRKKERGRHTSMSRIARRLAEEMFKTSKRSFVCNAFEFEVVSKNSTMSQTYTTTTVSFLPGHGAHYVSLFRVYVTVLPQCFSRDDSSVPT